MRITKRTYSLFAALGMLLCLLMSAAYGQQTAKKSYTFRGKVQQVDTNAKRLTVSGEKVEGWMDAMTREYKVDDPAVLKTVKAGDQIMATVYEGDMTLHMVMVTAKTAGASKNMKPTK